MHVSGNVESEGMASCHMRALVGVFSVITLLSNCKPATSPEAGGVFEWPVSTPAEQGLRADMLEQAAGAWGVHVRREA